MTEYSFSIRITDPHGEENPIVKVDTCAMWALAALRSRLPAGVTAVAWPERKGAITDGQAMTRLHAALTGVEWDASMWDVVSDIIIATGREIASPDDVGETEPRGADLLAEYEAEYPCEGADALTYDEARPFLLVEENVRGGYYLTLHETPGAAAGYQTGQECPGDWEVVELADLRDGSVSEVATVSTAITWKAKS